MNLFKKIYCRLFQGVIFLSSPFLPCRIPDTVEGLSAVPEVFEAKGVRRVLLVTTKGMRRRGTTDPLEEAMREKGIALTVYDEVCPNPTVDNVEAGFALYKAEGCQGIVAFGGGSPIDCAKGIAARSVRPTKSMAKLAGLMKVRRGLPPFAAVPTTAGSGSEVTPAAVITDGQSKHKYVMSDFCLIPHYAVLDPYVTVTMPPFLTATTGMDALTHAVEAYIGRSTTRYTRQMATEAVKAIFAYLEQAYTYPMDIEAREEMLWASYKAGLAFSRSYVGYVHAIAHTLGGEYNMAHGLANSVLLPYVLEAYGQAAEKKLHGLAVAIGVASAEDAHSEGAKRFIAAIRALSRRLHLPETLPELQSHHIPRLSAYAEREANPLYPVPRLMTREELAKIYEKILEKQ